MAKAGDGTNGLGLEAHPLVPRDGMNQGVQPGPVWATPGQYAVFLDNDIELGSAVGTRVNTDKPVLPRQPNTSHVGGDINPITDSNKAMGTSLWFEDVHILPREKFEFGNIITQKQETYEVYNAYRLESLTMNSITNNTTPGTELPDESPPEVVPALTSMLDSTTTDNLGPTFALGTMVKRDLIVLEDGLPVFDSDIVFNFTNGEMVSLFLSGQRLVLMPFEYESPCVETMAFLTDIIEAIDGKEQRIALRREPRQLFEVNYKLTENERQRMQMLLFGWQDKVFGFPLWHEQLRLTAPVAIGATQYQVATTSEVDLREGGLAVVITDNSTFDVINITTITGTLINSSDPSVNAYPVGTKIMPLRTARIRRAVPGLRHRNNLEEFRVTVEVTDNTTDALAGDTTPGTWSTYNSRVLLDDCNVTTGLTMPEEFQRRIQRIDSQTGIVSTVSHWDRNKRIQEKTFIAHNRPEILKLKQLLIAMRGRQTAFYIPTFIEDMVVVNDVSLGTATLDIRTQEYVRFGKAFKDKSIFRITFTDGSQLVREIVSAATHGSDPSIEVLTLDDTWPANRTADEFQRLEFYELARFDSDEVRIEYPRIGLASVKLPVKQVFDDN